MSEKKEERKNKHQLYKIALNAAKLRHHEADILGGYGVTSCKDLSDADLDTLIIDLQEKKAAFYKRSAVPPHILKLRSQVILAAEEYLYCKVCTPQTWARFNSLLLDKRICGKLLYQLNEQELKILIKKLRGINRKSAITPLNKINQN